MIIKMIVTDLDHTLLRSDKTISDYTANVLTRCRKKDIKIVFATARYFRTIQEWLVPTIGISPDIAISTNGGYAYCGSAVLYKATFNQTVGNRLVNATRTLGGAVTVGASKMRYCERPIEKTHESFSIQHDFLSDISEEFHYMDVRGLDNDSLNRLEMSFPELRCERYIGENLATFISKDARKGAALSVIAKNLSILPSEIVGFGDDNNDIDFLRICGTKVAVSNAIDDVKTIADFVCDSNDTDGVAKWLEEYVL